MYIKSSTRADLQIGVLAGSPKKNAHVFKGDTLTQPNLTNYPTPSSGLLQLPFMNLQHPRNWYILGNDPVLSINQAKLYTIIQCIKIM